MNGTVTMNIFNTAVEGETFEDAKYKVRRLPGLNKVDITEDSTKLSYILDQTFPIIGLMTSEPLKII